MTEISAETLEKLRQYDTPTICNVIELFEVRPADAGFMNASIQANFPELPPMVGFAATATIRMGVPPLGSTGYTDLPDQVERFGELSGPPVVVFQDLDNPFVAATFGEVMCTTYQAFGAQGLITSGAGRDLDQVQERAFPVFTSCTISSHGYVTMLDLHLPVHVGGVAIYPDALLHGDRNGVTTIPHEIAADVADASAEFVAAEASVLSYLSSGTVSLAGYREALAETDAQIKALHARVSQKP